MKLPALGRLGIKDLIADERGTWVEESEPGIWTSNAGDYLLFLGGPIVVGVVTALLGLQIWSVDAFLAGASITTALLFGLLVHVLVLGLQIAGDEHIARGSRIAVLADELRANVSWSCAVGLLLSILLVAVGSFTKDLNEHGTPPWFTGLVVAVGTHLVLSLLMVMKRVRTTYKMLGK